MRASASSRKLEPGAVVNARSRAFSAPGKSPKRSIRRRPSSNAASPARASRGYVDSRFWYACAASAGRPSRQSPLACSKSSRALGEVLLEAADAT